MKSNLKAEDFNQLTHREKLLIIDQECQSLDSALTYTGDIRYIQIYHHKNFLVDVLYHLDHREFERIFAFEDISYLEQQYISFRWKFKRIFYSAFQ